MVKNTYYMSTKTIEHESRGDTLKLLIAVALLVGGGVAFHTYSDISLLVRVLSLLAVAGVSVFILLQTAKGKSAWGFVRDSRAEVRKVVWPSRAESMQTTLVVVVMVLVVGIILWIMDSFLLWAVKMLTGQGD